MTALPSRDRLTLSRRQAMATAGSGVIGVLLGRLEFKGASAFAQTIEFGSTPTPGPAAAPVPVPPQGETPADVVARLGFDQDAIIAFVRNEIAYEAYSGILRGAQGTLSARAGNAADQAVLLGALLNAAQVQHRFAMGQLDVGSQEALTAQLSRTSQEAQATWTASETAMLLYHLGLPALPATPPALTSDTATLLNPFETAAREAVDLALSSSDASNSAIAIALEKEGIALPPLPETELPAGEFTQHVWIQIADGPEWIDVTPALPAERAAPTAAETMETTPDNWYHWMRFVIVADEWQFGAIARREVVSLSASSSRLVDVPIALSMASASELTEVGLAINQGLTGQMTIYPSLYADGVTVDPVTPLVFATDAGSAQDAFGGSGTAGLGEGETVAVWLRVEITSPDSEMIAIERPLLDRLPPEDRAAGVVALEHITPVKIAPTAFGADTIEQFNTLTLIHTDVARIPPTDAYIRYGQDPVFGPLGMFGPTLAGLRDLLGLRLETEAGVWSYPSAPNVTVFHASPGDQEHGDGRTTFAADLLYRQRTSLPLADAAITSATHPLVLSGVLDAVAEQVLLAPEFHGDAVGASAVATGPSVAGIFSEAATAGQPPRLITDPAGLAGLALDPIARGRLEGALTAGLMVVMPDAPVTLETGPALGWWIVDPVTGRTRDELESGLAGATTSVRGQPLARFEEAPSYTFLLRAIAFLNENHAIFACLGASSALSFLFVGSLIMLGDAAAVSGSMAAASASVVGTGGGGAAAWVLACA